MIQIPVDSVAVLRSAEPVENRRTGLRAGLYVRSGRSERTPYGSAERGNATVKSTGERSTDSIPKDHSGREAAEAIEPIGRNRSCDGRIK